MPRCSRRPAPLLSAALLLLAVTLLAGGCALLQKPDPRPVEAIVAHAEELIKIKAYAAAANEYAIVVDKQPASGQYHLRYTELLERTEQDKRARKAYERAVEQVPAGDPKRHELMLRLALIDANHLFLLDDAEDLLQQLPGNSLERYDLAGFLYYKSGQYEMAIKTLNQALERVKDDNLRGLMLYHAALVYQKLGDEKNTFGSLFHAINNSSHLGQIRDIEALWNELNKDGKPSSTTPKF